MATDHNYPLTNLPIYPIFMSLVLSQQSHSFHSGMVSYVERFCHELEINIVIAFEKCDFLCPQFVDVTQAQLQISPVHVLLVDAEIRTLAVSCYMQLDHDCGRRRRRGSLVVGLWNI